MTQLLCVISALISAISVLNYLTIRIPNNDAPLEAAILVLAPMRNEAENIFEFVTALSAQIGVPKLRVLLINDSSTDKSLDYMREAIKHDPRFSIMDSPALLPGWLGKVSALHSGYLSAEAEYIVTLDADVRLKPNALVRSINQLNDLTLDFVSPYPRQIAKSFSEKLIQPLLHWSWMSTVILRLAEKRPHRSTAVGNGQFFVVRKSALDSVGGFTSVSKQILDDIELARSLIAAGFKGVVTEGSAIASTRMYSSFDEIRQGYGKSLWKAFGGVFGSVIASLFVFATGVLPVILAVQGYLIGVLIYLLISLTREISALRSRSNPLYAFLHPISSLLLIYLICYSWMRRGKIQWKGRTV
jgi:cellulose synthase/poly-beta-1,6-N-acetylglucosamine synthase-like glycosyltransferase